MFCLCILHSYALLRVAFCVIITVSAVSPRVRESRTFLDSGFRAVDSGFRIPDSKKSWSSFFSGFSAFLHTSFSCSNLAILKDVVRRHNKFVFFFDLQNYGKQCITVP